jgi:hypothetical protein
VQAHLPKTSQTVVQQSSLAVHASLPSLQTQSLLVLLHEAGEPPQHVRPGVHFGAKQGPQIVGLRSPPQPKLVTQRPAQGIVPYAQLRH